MTHRRPDAPGRTPHRLTSEETPDSGEVLGTEALADVICRPVGVVRSRFVTPEGTPVQASGVSGETATVEVLPAYAAGLRDLGGFDHLILLTHLHRCAHEQLEVTPFLDTQPRGVFATRAPARPNHIGLSVVRLLSVEGRMLHIAGNDMVDGTPVLDIKPYVPQFDAPEPGRIGWLEGRLDALGTHRADGRFAADTTTAPATPGQAPARDGAADTDAQR